MYLTYCVHLVGLKRKNCKTARSGKFQKRNGDRHSDSRKGEKFLDYVCNCQLHSTLIRTVS
jgi:hypothetical protein